MPITFIPFDGWAPGPSAFGEGWQTVYNMAPVFNSWRPLRKLVADTVDSVAFGPMNGRHTHLWPSGVSTGTYIPDAATLYTGSKTRLFTVNPATGAFTDVSRATNYAAAGEPAGWRFASIGNDCWACNWYDVMQRRVNNAGLFTDGVVGSTVLVPRFMAPIREHLVVANMNQGGRFVDEIAWSDADDATNFDPPTGTSTSLAGSKRLTSIPGQITGLLGGQYGLAFKRTAIYYLEVTGSTQVFRPDVLSSHVGTAYGSSIINTRHGIFFFGPDGFYRIDGLAAPVKLSTPGIDGEIMSNLFAAQGALLAESEDIQMVGFSFPNLPLIGWLFRYDWSAIGNDRLILHNPVTGMWALGFGAAYYDAVTDLFTSVVTELPFGSDLYNAVGAISWNGSESRFAPFVEDSVRPPSLRLRYRPANLSDVNEYQQSLIKGILPLFSRKSSLDVPQPTVTVSKLFDPAAYPPAVPDPADSETRAWADRNLAGWYPFQIPGRYFEITINGTADDFNNFEGVWIDQEVLG